MEKAEVQSPYLPGTKIQVAWDSTSLGRLKTCPRLYYYEQIEGWQGKQEAIHLRFGIEYHQALQDYDVAKAAGVTHDEALSDVVHALLIRTMNFHPTEADYGKAAKYKNRENLIRAVVWYLDEFEHDPATTYIMEGGKPAVELSFRFELDWGPKQAEVYGTNDNYDKLEGHSQPYLLCGHLDRVVNFNDELFVMDRKTTTTTAGSYYFDQFQPNNQMTLYALAGRVVLKTAIQGIIIDSAQILIDIDKTGEPGARFARGMTYRTQDQLDEWMEDLKDWLAKAEGYATAGYWPMNDTACDKFGGCRFRMICSKSPQVRGQFLKSNFTQAAPEDRWNPLKAR